MFERRCCTIGYGEKGSEVYTVYERDIRVERV